MAEFQRPDIPYVPQQTLPNGNRYSLLSAAGQPPTADDLDGDFDYGIDGMNNLQEQINGLAVGILPGSDNTANVGKFPITNGQDPPDITWSKVTSTYLASNAVTTAKIAAQAVTGAQIANAAVNSAQIYPGAVTQEKMAENSIGTPQIQNDAVDTDQIAEGAVTTDELDDEAVTAAKIANNTITAQQIANNTITAQQIANNTITAQQLAPVIQPIIGSFIPWGGTAIVAPPGTLFPNGQNVSRVTYAALFAVYGITFGAGDGATTFGLPDLRGRCIVHLDMANANTPAATNGRVTTATANALTVGGTGGVQEVTLDVNQIPPHIHTVPLGFGAQTVGGPGGFTSPSAGPTNTSSIGGGQAHNNMPPFMFGQYLIYAGV